MLFPDNFDEGVMRLLADGEAVVSLQIRPVMAGGNFVMSARSRRTQTLPQRMKYAGGNVVFPK